MRKFGVVVIVASVCGWGCGSSAGDTSADANAEAKVEFWNAFGTANIDAVPAARDHLVAAFADHPTDDETARLIGMGYSLTFQERARMSTPPPASDAATHGPDALAYLQKAVDVSGDAHQKTWNTAFYGATLWATSQGNDAKQKEGRDAVSAVVRDLPIVGLFTRASVFSRGARGGDDFAQALEAYFLAYERCTGAPIDRAHPDLSRALQGPYREPLCGNVPHVPHHLQGELFTFADALVKNGQPDAARSVFEAIKRSDGYDGWAFRAAVEQRLGTDLAARAAQYKDGGDPRSEPSIGASPCLACHQR